MEPTSFSAGPPDRSSIGTGARASEFAVYLHSAKRAGLRSLAQALMDQSADLEIAGSVLLNGIDGFGHGGRLHADIQEGPIPLIVMATAVDHPSASSFAELLSRLPSETLATRANSAVLDATAGPLLALGDEFAQLTVHCRIGAGHDDPAGVAGVIDLLRRHGVAGATALSGGDGIAAGQRHRDLAFARSPSVPALVIAIDTARALATAVPALLACTHVDMVTAKPIWLWKGQGRVGGTPIAADADGWRTLSVFGTDDTHRWRPLHRQLIARLRKAGAAGATVIRARLAYVRDDPVRPQRGWRTRREAPTVTTIVDTRDQVARWFEIVDELIGDDGLVTCEAVRVLSTGD
jgi:PII-like signaling protein